MDKDLCEEKRKGDATVISRAKRSMTASAPASHVVASTELRFRGLQHGHEDHTGDTSESNLAGAQNRRGAVRVGRSGGLRGTGRGADSSGGEARGGADGWRVFSSGVEVSGSDGVDGSQADGLGERGGGRLSAGARLLGERERRQDSEENSGELHFE